MYYPFVRKALFQLDPERAHEFTFQQLRRITGTPFEALVRQLSLIHISEPTRH